MDLNEIDARRRTHRQGSGKIVRLSELRDFLESIADAPGEARVLMDEDGVYVEWKDMPAVAR